MSGFGCVAEVCQRQFFPVHAYQLGEEIGLRQPRAVQCFLGQRTTRPGRVMLEVKTLALGERLPDQG